MTAAEPSKDPVKNPVEAATPEMQGLQETPQQGNTPRPPGQGHGSLFLVPDIEPIPGYKLVHMLGRGGFGEVWRAVGPGGFMLALKFIRLAQKSGDIERRALEVMKGIRHLHLLSMFGSWQRDDLLIIAMELADRTLQDRLNETETLPRDEVLKYMREAADALDHLNGQGVQHRDVKPPNLLLLGGHVKVGDFGLAKILEHSITTASGCMSPAFAPPELFDNKASRWTDQYSLAVTYFQLRTGRLPFEGSALQVMLGHMSRPPDLTALPEIERPALARALAKQPEERWPSCVAFIDVILTAIGGRSTHAAAAPPASGVNVLASTLESPNWMKPGIPARADESRAALPAGPRLETPVLPKKPSQPIREEKSDATPVVAPDPPPSELQPKIDDRRKRNRKYVIVSGVLVTLLLGLAVLCMVPQMRDSADRLRSANNLKQIGIAMGNYHDTHMCFPPATVYSTDGTPLYSWRVLLLPYLEEERLYNSLKLDEPWNSDHNRKLLTPIPNIYQSVRGQGKDPNATYYQVFVGGGAVFDDAQQIPALNRAKRKTSIRDITDGTSNTLMAVEAEVPVPWAAPEDLP